MPELAADNQPDTPAMVADDSGASPNFSFRFQERRFRAWTEEDEGESTVFLACELGHLPYSAENRDGRRAGLMILSAASSVLSARLMLTDFHKISLLTSQKIPDADDLQSVVAAAAASVISSLPLIELMESSVSPSAA